jgi:protein-S-isoprenylcysteine O-methyltransferase Ste14
MSRGASLLGSLAFLVLAPGTVAGLVPWWISGWRLQRPLLGAVELRMVGAALIAGGMAALLDSFARFALRGLGTPAPVLPPSHLVVTGLYRHVRNPMYVALLWAVLGQALLFGDAKVLAYGLLLWIAFHLFVRGYEEPTLRRTFGQEYEVFCANVPRWLPRLRGWRGGDSAHR